MTPAQALDTLDRALALINGGVSYYAGTRGITAQYEAAKQLRKEYKAAVRTLKKTLQKGE